jgi:ribosomal protein S6
MLSTLNIDVIKTLNGEFDVEDIISQFQNFFFQRMILDITALKNYRDIKTLQKLSISLDMDKVILLLDDTVDEGNGDYLSKLISMGIYNFTKNEEGIMYLYNNPNSYRDVAHIQQLDTTSTEQVVVEKYNEAPQGVRIIGIKNVTKQTGATTLTYMMKKQLEHHYTVVGVEVDKNDFKFFRDKNLISTTSQEIGNTITKYSDKDVILVDVNDSKQAEDLCHEVIYLVEPSIIKLNKLMFTNQNVFKNLKGKKIILNQSVLSPKDVMDFEFESGAKIFYNMPPLDEREKGIHVLNKFLFMLGFSKQQDQEQEKKFSILGLFSK